MYLNTEVLSGPVDPMVGRETAVSKWENRSSWHDDEREGKPEAPTEMGTINLKFLSRRIWGRWGPSAWEVPGLCGTRVPALQPRDAERLEVD